jgi:hypothetical protein
MVRGRANQMVERRGQVRPFLSRDRYGAKLDRHRLVLVLLDARRPMTVAELGAAAGLPSKAVSDLLRTARTHGHVVRVGRGFYAADRVARSTEWTMRRNLDPPPSADAFAYTRQNAHADCSGSGGRPDATAATVTQEGSWP